MALFSQRQGIKPIKDTIQKDSIDQDLRNGLWDALHMFYWEGVKSKWLSNTNNADMQILINRLWHSYFKKPIDTINDFWERTFEELRTYFFECDWNETYDFIEFVAINHNNNALSIKFRDTCNHILEREVSAYRFIDDKITEITSDEEIKEIEEALSGPLKPVNTHLKSAL